MKTCSSDEFLICYIRSLSAANRLLRRPLRQSTYPIGVLAIGIAVLMGGCVPLTASSSASSGSGSSGAEPISPSVVVEPALPQPSLSSESVQPNPSEVERSPSPISPSSAPLSPTPEADAGQHLPISAEAEIHGQVIQLEVARTVQEQSKGLMHRSPLPDDRGMLFPFNPPRPVQFWMKNTPSPLDMVFLHNEEVQAIESDVPPCEADPCPVYGPGHPVLIDQVLELRSGRASELGLQVGDRVNIQFLN